MRRPRPAVLARACAPGGRAQPPGAHRLAGIAGAVLLAAVATGGLAACSDDSPATRATTTASPTTPPPSTTSGQTPSTSAAGGSSRVQVVQQQYGSCLTKLGAAALVDAGDGRSVTSSIKDGAVTLRWTVSGSKAAPADEGTADFLGTAGC